MKRMKRNRGRAGRPTNRNVKNRESALLFLRTAKDLSQEELAQVTGVAKVHIRRFENGWRGLTILKVKKLADYLGVSCSALLRNDFKEVFSRLERPIRQDPQRREVRRQRQLSRQLSRTDIGYAGEDWVTDQERIRLAGTPYANAVNPNFANDEKNHYDILSFTSEGEWVYIEVKATSMDEDEPFYMSAGEWAFLEECLRERKYYELHCVVFVNDPVKRSQKIYTASQVLEEFRREPNSYVFRKKEVTV